MLIIILWWTGQANNIDPVTSHAEFDPWPRQQQQHHQQRAGVALWTQEEQPQWQPQPEDQIRECVRSWVALAQSQLVTDLAMLVDRLGSTLGDKLLNMHDAAMAEMQVEPNVVDGGASCEGKSASQVQNENAMLKMRLAATSEALAQLMDQPHGGNFLMQSLGAGPSSSESEDQRSAEEYDSEDDKLTPLPLETQTFAQTAHAELEPENHPWASGRVSKMTSHKFDALFSIYRYSERSSNNYHLYESWAPEWIQELVRSRRFNNFFTVIIVLNCITMGYTAHAEIAETPPFEIVLVPLEHTFTVLFVVELGMRIAVHGCRTYLPTTKEYFWNFADGVLVFVTCFLFGAVIPIASRFYEFQTGATAVRILSVLRACRLLRLVRVIRGVGYLREVWLLLRGLSESMGTLLWTCVVIFGITYIFAVFGLVMICPSLKSKWEDAKDINEVHQLTELMAVMGGIDTLMMTLIQVLTLDSWNGLLRQLVKYEGWSWIYFYAYIAVADFVMMNLVTAIIVENAVAKSKADEEEEYENRQLEVAQELRSLQELFVMMDTNNDGTLCWSEFKAAFSDPTIARRWMKLEFTKEDAKDLFKLLDEGDGNIPTEDFFNGLRRMKGNAQSKDLVRLEKKLDHLLSHLSSSKHLAWSLSNQSAPSGDDTSPSKLQHGSGSFKHGMLRKVGERANKGSVPEFYI